MASSPPPPHGPSRTVSGPSALSERRTRRRRAVRVIAGLHASSLGRTCRPWAEHVVLGLNVSSLGCSLHMSSLGRTCRPWDACIVLGLNTSSLGRTRCTWAVRIVLAPYVLSLGRAFRPTVVRVVAGLHASLFAQRRRPFVKAGLPNMALVTPPGSPGRRGYAGSVCPPVVRRRVEGNKWGGNEGGKGDNAPAGLPHPGSPCWFFLPHRLFLRRTRSKPAHIRPKREGAHGELGVHGWERAGVRWWWR